MKIIVLSALFSLILSSSIVFAQQNEWYPGKGIQEGLLVKYRVLENDLTSGKNVILTIWFKNRDSEGNWNTYIIIEDEGRVNDGWVILSSKNLSPQGSYDQELDKAINIFKKTLIWLGSYVSADKPGSLNMNAIWGRIAAVGGVDILIRGQEELQAANNQWSTSIVGWQYGRESRIWVSGNAPLPIKAIVYAATTQEPIPRQFEFDLLENRITNEQPLPPEEVIKLPSSPLTQYSTTRQYIIDLYWRSTQPNEGEEPDVIRPGVEINVGPSIKKATGEPLQNVKYNITITDEGNNKIFSESVVAERGTYTHKVTFPQNGNYKITIILEQVTALGGVTGEIGIVEKAEFGLVAVPEFPISAVLAMASIVVVIIMFSRYKNIKI